MAVCFSVWPSFIGAVLSVIKVYLIIVRGTVNTGVCIHFQSFKNRRATLDQLAVFERKKSVTSSIKITKTEHRCPSVIEFLLIPSSQL